MSSYQSFEHAEVTKSLVAVTSASTLAASFLSNKDFYSFHLGHIVKKKQFWRLITSHFIFASPGEMVLGLLLLHQFRFFERAHGTRKYLAAVAFYLTSSTIAQCVLAYLNPGVAFPSGPYIFLFALFVQFWRDVPRSVTARLMGIPMTNKLLVYFAGLQAILGHAPGSYYSAAIGITLGLLYRTPILPFSRLLAPVWLGKMFKSTTKRVRHVRPANQARSGGAQRLIQPLGGLGGRGPRNRPFGNSGGFGLHNRRAPAANNNNSSANPPSAPAPVNTPCVPNVDHVQALVSMGFAEEAARAALANANNNLVIATNRLAEGL